MANITRDDLDPKVIKLNAERKKLQRGITVALKLVSSYELKIAGIDQELESLEQTSTDPQNSIPKQPEEELMVGPLGLNELAMHPKPETFVRRGALSAKEKERVRAEEEKKEKEAQQLAPGEKPSASKPVRPLRPGEKAPEPPQNPEPTIEMRKELLTQQFQLKDPRPAKKSLTELNRPENKEIKEELLKDPKFAKLYQKAEMRVMRYDKIGESLKKNLKVLMQSSSDVVKGRLNDLKKGRIGAGIVGLKEVSNSVSWGNEVARSAQAVVNGVKELYKEFDIKPEEAITKELLEEARPLFTNQMSEKSKADRDIDIHSRQNMLWGETKEITDEEKETLAIIKLKTGTDKLPSVEKKDDVNLVKMMIVDIVLEAEKEEKKKKAVNQALANQSASSR